MFIYRSLCKTFCNIHLINVSVKLPNSLTRRKFHITSLKLAKKTLPDDWGSKSHKGKRNMKLQLAQVELSAEDEEILKPLRRSLKEQGDLVRKLKEENASELSIKAHVQELKIRKKVLEDKILSLSPSLNFDRARMNDLIKRRFFYDVAFDLYGGVSGQYDFGPIGCDIMENLINEWQKYFIIEDQMMKVNCSIITPENILKASGHTSRFSDIMAKDLETGDCFRLDHVIKLKFDQILKQNINLGENEKKKIKETIAQLDSLSKDDLERIVREYDVRSPITGNKLSSPITFNLMFPISVGPEGNLKCYLRPETSQGIFVNFKNLLEFNNGKLPFACAQIGNAYRNEISPSSGLLRVREFMMAEIAHFSFPEDNTHPKYQQIANESLLLYSACDQMDGNSAKNYTINEALQKGLLSNEILSYYLARIQQFLLHIGIDKKRLRFRQHLTDEMAHYAKDCWDAEILTSHGWIECVGCAHRGSYDLEQHSSASGQSLTVERLLKTPKVLDIPNVNLNNPLIKKKYPEEIDEIQNIIKHLGSEDLKSMKITLEQKGSLNLKDKYHLTKRMLNIQTVEQTERIFPTVIEPSFGIGRIFYSLLEHSFRVREEDDARTYFSLSGLISPIKASIFSLDSNPKFSSYIDIIVKDLVKEGLKYRIEDTSGSIGKRYTRADEIAVPFGITLDFDTINKQPTTVTLRHRDSMNQIRLSISEVSTILKQLINGEIKWGELYEERGKFVNQDTKEIIER